MKKIILLALTALMMVECCDVPTEKKKVGEFSVIESDSCEYLKASYAGGISYLAHKGNCRFCKERRQKELEELMIKLKEK